jgi:ABC-type antimicrobial peptide transport system permease subunit
MIKSLTGLAFRFFRKNKFIAVSSILSVAISISLIITMALFVSNAKQSLVEEVQKMFGNMDLAIGYNPEQEKNIDSALLSEFVSFEAIEQSSNVLLTRMYVDQLGDTVYTIGAENDSLVKSRYHFSEDISDNEIILNERLSRLLGVEVDDSLILENRSYTVKEVTSDLEAAGPVLDTLILAKSRIQQIEMERTGDNHEATYILMKTKENRDINELVTDLKSVDPELRIDIATEDEFVRSNLDMLNQFIIVLSILILILTSLFIVSNFEVFLYKYKNQLAIMRALGATNKQIFKVVFLQSSLINIIGAMVGFILVLVTHQFVQNWLGPLFSISLTRNEFNFGMAIGVICISVLLIQAFMLIPAYRSSKVLPLTIMQENEAINLSYQKLRILLGIGLFIASAIFILLGVIFSNLVLLVLLGALFLVSGMFLLLPVYITPILNWFLPIIKSVFGNTSFITVKNLIPQVRKNILVVLIIGAMMIIAVFGSTFIQTIQHNDKEYVKKQFPTDVVLTGSISNESPIESAELKSVVKELESVKSVSTHSGFYSAEVTVGNNTGEVIYAYADLNEMEKQGLLSVTAEVDASKMIVRQEKADQYGLEVGDKVQAELFFESPVDVFTVASIVEELPNFGDVLIDWENNPEEPVFQMAFVIPADTESALTQLPEIKSQFPGLTITSYEQSLEQSEQMFVQRWSIFIVVLVVILFSVMLGVVNTLINNIHSRRKEYAVLRAISLSRKGIIQVVMTQVITYLLIGLLFGSTTGILLTYVISLVDPGTIQFDFQLVSFLVGAMVVISLVIFIPFANKIGKLTISEELMQDNK